MNFSKPLATDTVVDRPTQLWREATTCSSGTFISSKEGTTACCVSRCTNGRSRNTGSNCCRHSQRRQQQLPYLKWLLSLSKSCNLSNWSSETPRALSLRSIRDVANTNGLSRATSSQEVLSVLSVYTFEVAAGACMLLLSPPP